MVPTIGIMIGCYIFTRMLDIGSRKESNWLLILCALVTALVAVGGVLILFFGLLGNSAASFRNY